MLKNKNYHEDAKIDRHQCEEITRKLNALTDEYAKTWWGPIQYFGYPVYIMNSGSLEWDIKKIKRHNLFMKEHFPELLDWIKDFFEKKLEKPILFDDEIPFPGFHRFTCKPGPLITQNFHFDDYFQSLTENAKHLIVPKDFSLYSFTVLLSDPSDLESGVDWVAPTDVLTREKLFNLPFLKLKLISKKHIYNQGQLNLIGQDVFHNLFSINKTDQTKYRITLQGHLLETSNGYVFYW